MSELNLYEIGLVSGGDAVYDAGHEFGQTVKAVGVVVGIVAACIVIAGAL